MFTTRTRFTFAVAAIGAAAVLAVGCSSDDSDSHMMPGMSSMPGMRDGTTAQSATRSDFNDADVTFLQEMYPHHAQAVEMAEYVPARSQNQAVLDLAANISKAQAPEMEQIAGLLQSFGKSAPTTAMGHMPNMPGGMSHDTMDGLKALSGKDFDRAWLQAMIDHHAGAITMSNIELAGGTNPDAKALAQKIITTQQAEIDQMRTMLSQN